MCLLIVQKTDSKVSNKNLKNAWESNNDGVGYSFVNDGKIVTKKYMQFNPFKTSFNNDVKKYGSESAFLIHFRYATHGATDLTNVHPFNISNNIVFGHNGIINSVDDDIKLSDTRMFNKKVLKPLNKKDDNFMFKPVFRFLIENAIGSSKLAFLKSDGKFAIIGESLGHWNKDNSIWYSNGGYKSNMFGSCSIPSGYVRKIYPSSYKSNINNQSDFKFADDTLLECDWCCVKTDRLKNTHGHQLCDYCSEYSD